MAKKVYLNKRDFYYNSNYKKECENVEKMEMRKMIK